MAVALSSRAVGKKDLANRIAATYGTKSQALISVGSICDVSFITIIILGINGATPDEGNSVGNTYLDVDNTQLGKHICC